MATATLQVKSPNVKYTEDCIETNYTYSTSKVHNQDGNVVVSVNALISSYKAPQAAQNRAENSHFTTVVVNCLQKTNFPRLECSVLW